MLGQRLVLAELGPIGSVVAFGLVSDGGLEAAAARLGVEDAGRAVPTARRVTRGATGSVPEAFKVTPGDVQAAEADRALERLGGPGWHVGLLRGERERFRHTGVRLPARKGLPVVTFMDMRSGPSQRVPSSTHQTDWTT